jgi:hypothetical protein
VVLVNQTFEEFRVALEGIRSIFWQEMAAISRFPTWKWLVKGGAGIVIKLTDSDDWGLRRVVVWLGNRQFRAQRKTVSFWLLNFLS